MPLLLDTPHTFDPGAGQPVQTAAMVIIESVHLHLLESELIIQCEYGNVVDGAWVAIATPIHQLFIRNVPAEVVWDQDAEGNPVAVPVTLGEPHFDNFRAASLTAAADLPVFDEAKRHLYQYLLDQEVFAGSIV